MLFKKIKMFLKSGVFHIFPSSEKKGRRREESIYTYISGG